ncbi:MULTISPECIES: stage V sporulation protein AE [Shouchella]|uniref:Stage V sporulation protein AE n=2 Tax=Shouchella TaxID=2893057 RepID=A0ABY7W412_9BACI|nr:MULTISPECIES: stage V sporulation protein AE [Shouchella]MED4129941.1 stage V sporulation protein AE [Shouchella miscanthi]WDF03174.1 stage V sporulation protein AE [Shouchella hunanensis]GAF21350.1 stage V sporulation protein AE [Bacillus sp. JCM 19047]
MKKVIFVTDGDLASKKALEHIAQDLKCTVLSASYGNPTTIEPEALVDLINLEKGDVPIIIMFDDCGIRDVGFGETAMHYIVNQEDIEVIGAVAVASQTHAKEWTHVDVSVDRFGRLSEYGVDKEGLIDMEIGRINGDTVSILDDLNLPCVVGVGDIGKMARFDDVKKGAPVTKKAIQIILERSGYSEPVFETDDI